MTTLNTIMTHLTDTAQRKALSGKNWAMLAHVSAETLSRLAHRQTCDLKTVARLASVVGMKVAVVPDLEREMPRVYDRAFEEDLLRLCAMHTVDLRLWRATGPRYFMAGLAVMLSSERPLDRDMLLMLAEALYPGILLVAEYQHWLDTSPLHAARFLPMLRHHEHAHPADKNGGI